MVDFPMDSAAQGYKLLPWWVPNNTLGLENRDLMLSFGMFATGKP
jgi:hypothetical protein